jgi:hypothetical protein
MMQHFRFFELEAASVEDSTGSVTISLTTSTMASNRMYIMWGSYDDQIFLHGILPIFILVFCYIRYGLFYTLHFYCEFHKD